MRTFIFFCLAVVAAPAVLFAQAGVTDPQTLKICSAVKDTPLPAADRPSPEEAKNLAGCKSEDFYYGFSAPPDFEKARKCAYVELDNGNTHQPFGGKSILMMVYANGKGAGRNFDLAQKFACELSGDPGDVAGTIRQLQLFKETKWSGQSFSVCNHSSGRYMYAQCALLDYRFDHADREKELDSMAEKMTPQQKKAFAELRHAAAAFFKVQAAKGQDLTGTFEIQEVAFHERNLVSSLEQFEQGDLPKLTPADDQKNDAAMKETFDKTQTHKFGETNTLTAAGLTETQQAWMPYRDAWIKFGMARYPQVSAAEWRAWITELRTEMLQKTLY